MRLTAANSIAASKLAVEGVGVAPLVQSEFESLSRGADSKRKRYVCVVWVSRAIKPADLAPLNTDEDVVVQQITPGACQRRRQPLPSRAVPSPVLPDTVM